jgi:hypothetical protein
MIKNIISPWFTQLQNSIVDNPFKDSIIEYLNLLTNTNNTDYNGIIPTTIEIAESIDLINGEII